MGIYVQTFASRPFGRSAEKLAGQIASSARTWAISCGLEALFFAGAPRADGISLSIYPPAGGIEIEIARGRVSFGIKTSIAGPGYHRALIDLCDRLQKEVGLKWRWDAGGDQTGYAVVRNERALRREYARQANALCEVVSEKRKGIKNHRLNLPIDLAAGGYIGVATPGGPLSPAWFEGVSSVCDEASECAPFLMPWWNDPGDGRFWADTLRAILWTEVEWRAPRTPWELHVQNAAVACYEHLNDGQRTEFEAAMAELKTLTDRPEGTSRPAADGIGWKRRLRSFPITGPWQINLPGYYVDTEVSDETVCIRFEDEEIRGSSFVVETTGERPMDWREGYMNSPEMRTGNDIRYRICSDLVPLKDREGWVMAAAEYHTMRGPKTHHILFLSIYTEKSRALKRIEEVACGVWFDPNSKFDSVPFTD